MEINLIFGYLGALAIGLVLGLLGGGGSILTVPVLAYLFYLNPVTATAYSLFVVGVASLVGTIKYFKEGLVNLKVALVFAAPAMLAVYVTRKYLIPAIPQELFSVGDFVVSKDIFIMLFFAAIMLLAAISMIRTRKKINPESTDVYYNYPLILVEGLSVGVLTGVVGAGGGFLIIPALVILAKLPIKQAIATSLLIIAIKSLVGFLGDVFNFAINWPFLLVFTGIAVVGIFIGTALNKRVKPAYLKRLFGYFVLIMAIYIIIKEVFL